MVVKSLRTLSLLAGLALSGHAAADCPALYQHPLQSLKAQPLNLCESHAGKVVLVVNTASHCGFTRQFKGLEALYQRYKDQGFTVLGVPSDDFFQEANDTKETAEVCYVNYGVTFTMTQPQHVRGDKAHPLFQTLISESGQAPRWNFYKYLVGRDGKVIAAYNSKTEPEDDGLRQAIEKAL